MQSAIYMNNWRTCKNSKPSFRCSARQIEAAQMAALTTWPVKTRVNATASNNTWIALSVHFLCLVLPSCAATLEASRFHVSNFDSTCVWSQSGRVGDWLTQHSKSLVAAQKEAYQRRGLKNLWTVTDYVKLWEKVLKLLAGYLLETIYYRDHLTLPLHVTHPVTKI